MSYIVNLQIPINQIYKKDKKDINATFDELLDTYWGILIMHENQQIVNTCGLHLNIQKKNKVVKKSTISSNNS